ncbi:hypothetical protein AWB67_05627 [Caballeronia terrestris]|uniref:Uncharacterized protein n=1 Tax=Caballeronia terrestris TaxID=1226301 RepID=A0A158KH34_9BURK|nr:hypothetical protein [Caballeronia terrestris]SAL80456.1 hypothetical protein AWB67_05627 [Caballeronia terrestris]
MSDEQRLMVRIVLPVVVASGFAMTMDRAHGQGHCDITGRYTCTYPPCQNHDVGAAWVIRLAGENSYLFHNEVGTEARGSEDLHNPNTYQIPAWGSTEPDAACNLLIFNNGTHWTRSGH